MMPCRRREASLTGEGLREGVRGLLAMEGRRRFGDGGVGDGGAGERGRGGRQAGGGVRGRVTEAARKEENFMKKDWKTRGLWGGGGGERTARTLRKEKGQEEGGRRGLPKEKRGWGRGVCKRGRGRGRGGEEGL